MLELSPNGPSIAGLTFLVLSYNKCLRLIIIEIFLFNKIPSTNFLYSFVFSIQFGKPLELLESCRFTNIIFTCLNKPGSKKSLSR